MECIATFGTSHSALMFERLCKKEGLGAKIIPVPRSLSSSCGLACKFPCEAKETLCALSREKKIDVEGYYETD